MGEMKEKAKKTVEKVKEKAKKADCAIQELEKSYLSNRAEMGECEKKKLEEARKRYFQDECLNSEQSLKKSEKILGALGVELYQTYLPYVSDAYRPVYEMNSSFNELNRIVYFDITRWVNDTEEKNIDKLVNVYQVLANETCNIALIYDRKVSGCKVSMAIANTGKIDMPNIVSDFRKRVMEAIYGNFPGAEIKDADDIDNEFGYGIPKSLKHVIKYKDENVSEVESVAAITNLATDKSEDFASQSMEKLLDGIVPESKEQEYKLILLASPSPDVTMRKGMLCEMYNCLSPYASWQESFSKMENMSIGTGSSLGMNFGVNFAKSVNHNESVGRNKGETRTCTNYTVKHSLDLLEEQVKRLEQCSALGMWKFAAYVISQDAVVANNVATMYLALTQGETSYLSQSAINFWHGTRKKEDAAIILATLKRIQHPQFILDCSAYKDNADILMFPEYIDLTTLISGKELVRALNFPRKSVAGFPVIESVSFGRETQRFSVSTVETEKTEKDKEAQDSAKLDIGNVVHMYRAENQRVKLDVDSLTSHVFVTGSTGTGKSNTIYQILSGLLENDKKVLVIEPAKGEYRTAFGDKCQTYGTNPKISRLLRINPFAFPTGDSSEKPIHVLEHIDRLIEILNACWPMYAAMPAVLKDAVEQAYINKGWDLYTSECYPLEFPTFADVLVTLPEIMQNSMYSKDTQSDYAGALVTRVKSLTNGINGLVLCATDGEELSDKELFEQNVIVDISRVGSSETKALLMGVLIMKLQEYHMSSSRMNANLQHVTVLEEAHNLLRKTSMGQSQEGANLQGKSVEMLTNSIAEMRSYGEGFIIADQAPGLLDEAVIRNTNTKVILRLPDAEDRLLVGKAAALSEEQIDELAKLPRGVAAVYQNDWVEAVLCQFEKFHTDYVLKEEKFELPKRNMPTDAYFRKLFVSEDDVELEDEEVDRIRKWIDSLPYTKNCKKALMKGVQDKKTTEKERKLLAYTVFDGKKLWEILSEKMNLEDGIDAVNKKIKNKYKIADDDVVEIIRQNICQYIAERFGRDITEIKNLESAGRKMV